MSKFMGFAFASTRGACEAVSTLDPTFVCAGVALGADEADEIDEASRPAGEGASCRRQPDTKETLMARTAERTFPAVFMVVEMSGAGTGELRGFGL